MDCFVATLLAMTRCCLSYFFFPIIASTLHTPPPAQAR